LPAIFGCQTSSSFLDHPPARPTQAGTFRPLFCDLVSVFTMQIADIGHLEQDLPLEIVTVSLWFEQHGGPLRRLD
jgi:hypothetical protein